MKKNQTFDYYVYMKNKSVFNKLKIPVDNILEIRLPYLSWNKIKCVAVNKNCSYSWVVRYAIFRMIKRNKQIHSEDEILVRRSKKVARLNELVQSERVNSEKKHRHRLCLYGQDELFIRMSAAKLGCTMTHLVRLALALYLDELVQKFPYFGYSKDKNGRFSGPAWRCLGIKVFRDAKFPTISPRHQHIEFTYYEKKDYW